MMNSFNCQIRNGREVRLWEERALCASHMFVDKDKNFILSKENYYTTIILLFNPIKQYNIFDLKLKDGM